MQILLLDNTNFKDVISLIRSLDSEFSWSNKQVLESLEKNLVFGLYKGHSLKAVAIYSYIFETAELLYICVDKLYQNRGVAQKVLISSFEFLKEKSVEEILLEVNINNIKAIKLYSKLGFKKISSRKNYYKSLDGKYSDALIYHINI